MFYCIHYILYSKFLHF